MLGITAKEAKAFVDNGQLIYEHLGPANGEYNGHWCSLIVNIPAGLSPKHEDSLEQLVSVIDARETSGVFAVGIARTLFTDIPRCLLPDTDMLYEDCPFVWLFLDAKTKALTMDKRPFYGNPKDILGLEEPVMHIVEHLKPLITLALWPFSENK